MLLLAFCGVMCFWLVESALCIFHEWRHFLPLAQTPLLTPLHFVECEYIHTLNVCFRLVNKQACRLFYSSFDSPSAFGQNNMPFWLLARTSHWPHARGWTPDLGADALTVLTPDRVEFSHIMLYVCIDKKPKLWVKTWKYAELQRWGYPVLVQPLKKVRYVHTLSKYLAKCSLWLCHL